MICQCAHRQCPVCAPKILGPMGTIWAPSSVRSSDLVIMHGSTWANKHHLLCSEQTFTAWAKTRAALYCSRFILRASRDCKGLLSAAHGASPQDLGGAPGSCASKRAIALYHTGYLEVVVMWIARAKGFNSANIVVIGSCGLWGVDRHVSSQPLNEEKHHRQSVLLLKHSHWIIRAAVCNGKMRCAMQFFRSYRSCRWQDTGAKPLLGTRAARGRFRTYAIPNAHTIPVTGPCDAECRWRRTLRTNCHISFGIMPRIALIVQDITCINKSRAKNIWCQWRINLMITKVQSDMTRQNETMAHGKLNSQILDLHRKVGVCDRLTKRRNVSNVEASSCGSETGVSADNAAMGKGPNSTET
eukprot:6473006-Amphidinium_carterae.2